MRPTIPPPKYPLHPVDQYERAERALATLAECLAVDLSAGLEDKIPYWHARIIAGTDTVEQLREWIIHRGRQD